MSLLVTTIFTIVVFGLKVWRGESVVRSMRIKLGPIWPWPLVFLEAFTRSYAVGAIGLWLFFVGMSASLAIRISDRGIRAGIASQRILAASGIVLVGALGLAASIALFNQPKFLVARALRIEPGLLARIWMLLGRWLRRLRS
jgi:hypothetical protein